MQILLSLFIIIFFSFSSHSFSEDISDFEIEGISVDEYVFKYFTNETLKNSKQKKDLFNYYKDSYGSSLAEDVNKANTGTFQVKVDADSNKLETYDEVQVEYFGTTEVIKSVSGAKHFDERNCNKKYKEAVNDVSKILSGDYKLDKETYTRNQILVNFYNFKLNSGGSIEVACYDNFIKNSSWTSVLVLTINSKGIKKNDEEEERKKKIEYKSEYVKIKPRQDQIQSGTEGRIKF